MPRDETCFEERLRRSESRLIELLDSAPEGILIHRGLQYVYANPAALRLVGRSYDEIVGHSPFELVPPRFRLRLAERIMEAYTTRAPMPEEEEHLLHASGAEVPVEVVTVPVVFGGELATLVHVRDVAVRRELEIRLRAGDRLASAGLVAAGVAHEIHSPLTSALAALTELRDRLARAEHPEERREERPEERERGREGEPSEVSTLVASALESVERATRAASQARVFMTSQRSRPSRVDVHEILDACVSFLGPDMRSQVNIVRRYGDVPPVLGDASRLAHVFSSLLTNAVHAMSQRTRCANDVTITTSTRGGSVIVAIEDTGVGLHPEVQRAIFEPRFTPAHRSVDLGLVLSRRLVEDEQGELTVESELGAGTTFYVALRAAPGGGATSARTHERAQGKRLLVVEDEARMVPILRSILGGHRTTFVRNSHEALQQLHAGETFDLVICDLVDELDGMDLHRRIRMEWPGLEARMIFLTGDGFLSRTQEFLESLPNGHLQKPFEPVELLDLVDDVLAGR